MSKASIILLLLVGVALVIGSVLLRIATQGKHEIKTVDLVFLIIPLLLVALATGKLKGIDLFGVKADLSVLWAEAAQTTIQRQVAPTAATTVQDAVQVMEMAMKGGTDQVRQLLDRHTAAVVFTLGHGGYYGPAIRTYFDALSGSANLRLIIVTHPDGALFGLYPAGELISYLRLAGEPGYAQFQQWLNSGDAAARAALATLPGFISADHAVTTTVSKRDALARMEALKVDSLPVVDDQGRFLGTVERTQLITSLILTVTDQLEGR